MTWSEPWQDDHAVREEQPAPLRLRDAAMILLRAVVLGVVLALAWWLLAPAAREASAPNEIAVASDATLLILATLTGLANGLALVTRGGPLSLARVIVTFVAACVGAVIATVLGVWLGAAASLGIVAAALMWPVALMVVIGFTEALRYAMSHEE